MKKKILYNLEEIIAAVGLIVCLCPVIANVALRIFGSNILWAEEVANIGFAWMSFVGASAAYKRHKLAGIDMLVNSMPEKVKQVVRIAMYVLLVVLCAVILVYSFQFSMGAWTKKTPVLRIPYSFIDFSCVVGFAFMTFHSIRFLFCMLRGKPINGLYDTEDEQEIIL